MARETVVVGARRVDDPGPDRRAGGGPGSEIVADLGRRRVLRVGGIGADVQVDLVVEEDLGDAGVARCREGGEVRRLEDIDRAAADRVRHELAVERRGEKVVVAAGAADRDVDLPVEELLLIGEDREPQLLLAVDLLHRRVVADERGRIALAVALDHREMHEAAVEAGDRLQVEVETAEDLVRIGRALLDAARRVAGRLADVRQGEGDALGDLHRAGRADGIDRLSLLRRDARRTGTAPGRRVVARCG